jgi:hypothetical protein
MMTMMRLHVRFFSENIHMKVIIFEWGYVITLYLELNVTKYWIV